MHLVIMFYDLFFRQVDEEERHDNIMGRFSKWPSAWFHIWTERQTWTPQNRTNKTFIPVDGFTSLQGYIIKPGNPCIVSCLDSNSKQLVKIFKVFEVYIALRHADKSVTKSNGNMFLYSSCCLESSQCQYSFGNAQKNVYMQLTSGHSAKSYVMWTCGLFLSFNL